MNQLQKRNTPGVTIKQCRCFNLDDGTVLSTVTVLNKTLKSFNETVKNETVQLFHMKRSHRFN